MSINATTLSSAIGESDVQLSVASATGISAPNFTTGANVTYLFVENEMMVVQSVSGTYIGVVRGQLGTQAVAHAKSAPVLAGLVSDFPTFTPAIASSFVVLPPNKYAGFSPPVASAATIAASGGRFHVTGGTAINIITPPSGMLEGEVTIIFDSACTWTSSAVTNGIAASGTNTTAASAVTFYLDAATGYWYPSRLA
jgi:hypothetical protein